MCMIRTALAGLVLAGLAALPVGAQTTDVFNMADTWNDGGTVFSAIKMDVTNTASAAGSLVLDLEVGSANIFGVDPSGNTIAASGAYYSWASRARIHSPADSIIRLSDAAGTDFARLQFGGTTSSFPALKRNGAGLDLRLADDSAYGVLTALRGVFSGGTVTADAPPVDITQAWNNSGILGPLIKGNVTDTSSNASALLMDLQAGSVSKFRVKKDGTVFLTVGGFEVSTTGTAGDSTRKLVVSNALYMASGATLSWSSSATDVVPLDLILQRDAANVLALRNSTNAQLLRVYNTYTDASNREQLDIGWGGNILYIQTGQAGSGTSRAMRVGTTGAASLTLGSNNNDRWRVDGDGHFLAATDNTYDIGASGATRPRAVYVAGNGTFGGILFGTYLRADSGGSISFLGSTQFATSADGVLRIMNNAGTDFGRLQFGGTTSSFPALKRSSATLQARLADDSAYASFASLDLTAFGRIAHSTKEAITVDAATTFAVTSGYITLACTDAEAIDTITGGISGMILTIEHTDSDCTLNDDDDATAANAIDLTGTATNDVGAAAKLIQLLYNGTHWVQVSESDN